jgi:hypothetical protein
MAKIIPITEHFQHFLAEMKESFWGDLYGQTRQAWQQFFELQSERQRDRFSGWGRYERPMVCFVNVESVDRIIYSIFQRFNLEWKTRTLNLFTQAA